MQLKTCPQIKLKTDRTAGRSMYIKNSCYRINIPFLTTTSKMCGPNLALQIPPENIIDFRNNIMFTNE